MNGKPQAGGHVRGPCKRSISRRKDLLPSLPICVLSPHNASLLFTFSRAVLRAVPQLTERLVEASNQCTHLILFTFITAKLRENRGKEQTNMTIPTKRQTQEERNGECQP